MKKRYFLIITIFAIILYLSKKTYLFENLWGQITDRNYIIPDESSLLKFQVTKMNQGSGDWWLYGEDENYYFSTETDTSPYVKIAKKSSTSMRFFDAQNSATWEKGRFQKYELVSKNLETIYIKYLQWAAMDRPNFILVKDYEKYKNQDNLVDYCFYVDGVKQFPKEIEDRLKKDLAISISGKFYKTKQFDGVFPNKVFSLQQSSGSLSFTPKDGFFKVFVFDYTMTR